MRQKVAELVVEPVAGPVGLVVPAAFAGAFAVNDVAAAAVDGGASGRSSGASSCSLGLDLLRAETRPRFVAQVELGVAPHSFLLSATVPRNGCGEGTRLTS